MSETPAEPTPAQEPEGITDTTPAVPPIDEVDWKAKSREWEKRAKENKAAADKLAELEEAQKTAEQKTAERLAAAERRAQELEAKAMRAEIAAAKGVPSALLTGSTEDELNAAADALLAWHGDAAKTPHAPSAAGQGNVGNRVGAGQLTDADLASMTPEQINTARREGRLNDLLRRR